MRLKRRPFAFERLEDRRLLAASPIRLPALNPVSVGYVSSPIVEEAPDLVITMGYGPPDKGPPTLAQVGVGATGASASSIGGRAEIQVQDTNPDWKIVKVEYDVTGAIEADQTLGAVVGHSTPFTGFVQNYTFGVDAAGISLFWDDNPGTKTIEVAVTYNDPAHTVLHPSATATVFAPVVAETTLTGYPMRVGYAVRPNNVLDTNRWGLLLGGPFAAADGVAFTADVTSRPSAGEFGIVQFVTYLRYEEESAVSLRETTVPGGFWVDCPPNAPEPELEGVWTPATAGSAQFILPGRSDSPGVFSKLSDIPVVQDRATRFMATATLETYLVWHPTNGGYVAVDHISWEFTGTAVYNCDLDDPNAATQYFDPNNWSVQSDHDQFWQQSGDKSVQLLEYENNAFLMMSTTITPK